MQQYLVNHASIPLAKQVCPQARCLFAGQKLMIHMRNEIVLQMGQCTGKAVNVYTFTGQSFSAVSCFGEEANCSLQKIAIWCV